MPKRANRAFSISVTALTAAFFILSAVLWMVLQVSGISLVQYRDGTVMLGEPGRADLARPPEELPPVAIPIVNAPRPTVPVETVEPDHDPQELSFNEIYKKVVKSVTVIMSESRYGSGTGSGIIMSEDGYIITNNHVVEYSEEITVMLHDGAEYTARLIGADRLSDLAVIKINAAGLTPAEFGNSDLVEHGDSVAAIGNPLGIELRNTITSGIISGVNRDIVIEDSAGDITMTVLQTNCAVNPGNSGGPLLNRYGQVIGIISSKIMGSASQTVEGLGFAIPSSTAAPLVAQLIENGFVKGRPALGIMVDTSYRATYGLPDGVFVTDVNEASDAHAKGLQEGDIITHINGTPVSGIGDVSEIKNGCEAGDILQLTVYRQGQTLLIDVMLMEEGSLR